MSSPKLRVGDVLKALAKHPDVIKRKKNYLEAVAAAKSINANVMIDGEGWHIYKANKYKGNRHITMGLWTSLQERMELLEDMFLCKNQDNLIRSIQTYGEG